LQAVRAAGLPDSVGCRLKEHRDHALTGLQFLVEPPERALPYLAGRDHRHTSFREIRERLSACSLPDGVKGRAVALFALLAEAEGRVHGVSPEQVSFHELGGWDSIADMVAAAFLVEALGAQAWTVSALPQGSGRVKTEHGVLPVPTPATALLLEGFVLVSDGLQGERVTPTGAAILRHIDAGAQSAAQQTIARRLVRSGHGFGTRVLPGLSNVLRLLVFEEVASWGGHEQIGQIAFEVDDQTPEDLAIALDRLRARPGVLDVLQMPAFGKKGRLTVQVQILVQPEHLDQVCETCFRETATLGLRVQTVQRRALQRSQATVEAGGRLLRVKLTDRPAGRTAKVESADLVGESGGRAEREHLRDAGAEAGLGEERQP
jgi:uncharacterized protein (TIGR00299 family) protein